MALEEISVASSAALPHSSCNAAYEQHAGPLPPLLEWLAAHGAAELTVTPLGLSALYHRYHGTEP